MAASLGHCLSEFRSSAVPAQLHPLIELVRISEAQTIQGMAGE